MPRKRPARVLPENGQAPLPGIPKPLTAEDLYPDGQIIPPEVLIETKYLSGYKIGAAPSRAMIESVRRFGILHPIGVIPVFTKGQRGQGSTFLVCDGRRRVQAALLAGLTEVPARVYANQGQIDALLTLVANGQRRPNPWAEWLAIRDLLAAGAGMALIAEVTGLPIGTMKRRQKLGNLIATIAREVDDGRISATVAEGIAALPQEYQERLLDPLVSKGRLTLGDVRAVRKVQTKAGGAEYLPQSLFGGDAPPPTDHLSERYDRVYAALCAALGPDVAAAIASGQGADGTDAEVPFSDEADEDAEGPD